VPVIISRAATTDQGLAAAEKFGITLICFSRQERFTVYTHPGRIRDLCTDECFPFGRAMSGKSFEEQGNKDLCRDDQRNKK
jgi:FdhD protein